MFVVCLIDTPPRTFIWKQPLIDYPHLFPISSFEMQAGLILPYKRQSIFEGISVDYGLKSVCGSERIPLKLSGRKYDLTNYQWKSSVFGYVPIDLGSVNLLNLLDRRGLWPRTSSWTQQSRSRAKHAWFESVIISIFLLAGLPLYHMSRAVRYFVVDFSWQSIPFFLCLTHP